MAKYIVQHRRGTAAQWSAHDTIIPMEGELVIEIDDEKSMHKLKIGDGIHAYSELAYLMAGDEIVTQVLAEARPRVVTVTLDVDQWTEVTSEADPRFGYYGHQMVLDNITAYSRLDLQPDVDMLAEFKELDIVFVSENKGGVITVYSIGDMPLKSYTMQATIIESDVIDDCGKVVGATVGTPAAKPDWNQTDETKADYIKNKPDISDVLRYTEQTLTEEQKAQARANIGVEQGGGVSDNYITQDDLQSAIDIALTQAKESGEFNGKDGADGYTPIKDVDYFDGKDGYTPVKGVDYFTESDKEELVQELSENLPTVDATLSQSGQAADAQATGNQLSTKKHRDYDVIDFYQEYTQLKEMEYTDYEAINASQDFVIRITGKFPAEIESGAAVYVGGPLGGLFFYESFAVDKVNFEQVIRVEKVKQLSAFISMYGGKNDQKFVEYASAFPGDSKIYVNVSSTSGEFCFETAKITILSR